MEIINYEKKEMIQLTLEENISYDEHECHICEGMFWVDEDDEKYKNRKKVKNHCHYTGKFRGAAHSKCNLNYKIPNNIPIIIHNVSYDTRFIMNQLAEEYITFSVPNKKKCDGNKTITLKLRFIDSFRLMPASLSDHVDSFSGRIFNSIACTYCMERKKIIRNAVLLN